jgi:hypothetical protein
MSFTSRVSGPTAAARTARRFRFVFADSYRRDVSSKRRKLVAEHVAGWMSGTIVADLRVGADTIIAVDVARPVSVSVAEEYIRACPHYVAGTFAVVAR